MPEPSADPQPVTTPLDDRKAALLRELRSRVGDDPRKQSLVGELERRYAVSPGFAAGAPPSPDWSTRKPSPPLVLSPENLRAAKGQMVRQQIAERAAAPEQVAARERHFARRAAEKAEQEKFQIEHPTLAAAIETGKEVAGANIETALQSTVEPAVRMTEAFDRGQPTAALPHMARAALGGVMLPFTPAATAGRLAEGMVPRGARAPGALGRIAGPAATAEGLNPVARLATGVSDVASFGPLMRGIDEITPNFEERAAVLRARGMPGLAGAADVLAAGTEAGKLYALGQAIDFGSGAAGAGAQLAREARASGGIRNALADRQLASYEAPAWGIGADVQGPRPGEPLRLPGPIPQAPFPAEAVGAPVGPQPVPAALGTPPAPRPVGPVPNATAGIPGAFAPEVPPPALPANIPAATALQPGAVPAATFAPVEGPVGPPLPQAPSALAAAAPEGAPPATGQVFRPQGTGTGYGVMPEPAGPLPSGTAPRLPPLDIDPTRQLAPRGPLIPPPPPPPLGLPAPPPRYAPEPRLPPVSAGEPLITPPNEPPGPRQNVPRFLPDRTPEGQARARAAFNAAAPKHLQTAARKAGFPGVWEAREALRTDENAAMSFRAGIADEIAALPDAVASPVGETVPPENPFRPAALEPEAPPAGAFPENRPRTPTPAGDPFPVTSSPQDRPPTPETQAARRAAKEAEAVLEEQTRPERGPAVQPKAQGPQPRRLTGPTGEAPPPGKSVEPSPPPAPEPPKAPEPAPPAPQPQVAAPVETGGKVAEAGVEQPRGRREGEFQTLAETGGTAEPFGVVEKEPVSPAPPPAAKPAAEAPQPAAGPAPAAAPELPPPVHLTLIGKAMREAARYEDRVTRLSIERSRGKNSLDMDEYVAKGGAQAEAAAKAAEETLATYKAQAAERGIPWDQIESAVREHYKKLGFDEQLRDKHEAAMLASEEKRVADAAKWGVEQEAFHKKLQDELDAKNAAEAAKKKEAEDAAAAKAAEERRVREEADAKRKEDEVSKLAAKIPPAVAEAWRTTKTKIGQKQLVNNVMAHGTTLRNEAWVREALDRAAATPTADPFPKTAEAAAPAKSDVPAAPLKVGDAERIMGVDSVLAETKDVDGMRYELFNGAALKEKRGAIRVTDPDTGLPSTIKQFPTYDAAERAFREATGKKPATPASAPKTPTATKPPKPTFREWYEANKGPWAKVTTDPAEMAKLRAEWEGKAPAPERAPASTGERTQQPASDKIDYTPASEIIGTQEVPVSNPVPGLPAWRKRTMVRGLKRGSDGQPEGAARVLMAEPMPGATEAKGGFRVAFYEGDPLFTKPTQVLRAGLSRSEAVKLATDIVHGRSDIRFPPDVEAAPAAPAPNPFPTTKAPAPTVSTAAEAALKKEAPPASAPAAEPTARPAATPAPETPPAPAAVPEAATPPAGDVAPVVAPPAPPLIASLRGALESDGPQGLADAWARASLPDRSAATKVAREALAARGVTVPKQEAFGVGVVRRLLDAQDLDTLSKPLPQNPFPKGSAAGKGKQSGAVGAGVPGTMPSLTEAPERIISGLRDVVDTKVNPLWEKAVEAPAKGVQLASRAILDTLPDKGAAVREALDTIAKWREEKFKFAPDVLEKKFPGFRAMHDDWTGGGAMGRELTKSVHDQFVSGVKQGKVTGDQIEAVRRYLMSETSAYPQGLPPAAVEAMNKYLHFSDQLRRAGVELGVWSPESYAEFNRYLVRQMTNQMRRSLIDTTGSRARVDEVFDRQDAHAIEVKLTKPEVEAVLREAGIDPADKELVGYLKQIGRHTFLKFKPKGEGIAGPKHAEALERFKDAGQRLYSDARQRLAADYKREIVGDKGVPIREVMPTKAEAAVQATEARRFIEARRDVPSFGDLIVREEEPLSPALREQYGEIKDPAVLMAKGLHDMFSAVENQRFLKSIADRWGVKVDRNPDGTMAPPPPEHTQITGAKMGPLRGLWLPNELANEIKGSIRIIEQAQNGGVGQWMLGAMRGANAEWKTWRTLFNPRNYVQNTASLPIEGIEAGLMVDDIPAFWRNLKTLERADIFDPKYAEWVQNQVTSGARLDIELLPQEKTLMPKGESAGRAMLNPFWKTETFGKARDFAAKHYNLMGEATRATLYEKNRARGMSVDAALNDPKVGVNEFTTSYHRQSNFVKSLRKYPVFPWATYATERLRIMGNNLHHHPVRVATTLALMQAITRGAELAYEAATGDTTNKFEKEGAKKQGGGVFGGPFTAVLGHRDDGSIRTIDTGPAVPLDAPFRGPRESLDDQGWETANWAFESVFGPLGPLASQFEKQIRGKDDRGQEFLRFRDRIASFVGDFAPPFFPGVPGQEWVPAGRQAETIYAGFKGEQRSKARPAQTPAESLMDAFLYGRVRGYEPWMAMDSLKHEFERSVAKSGAIFDKDLAADPAAAAKEYASDVSSVAKRYARSLIPHAKAAAAKGAR